MTLHKSTDVGWFVAKDLKWGFQHLVSEERGPGRPFDTYSGNPWTSFFLLGLSAWETSAEIAWPSFMTIGLSLAVISLVIGCLEALNNPSLCKFGSLPPPEVPPVESSSGKCLPNRLADGYHIAVDDEDRDPTIKLS